MIGNHELDLSVLSADDSSESLEASRRKIPEFRRRYLRAWNAIPVIVAEFAENAQRAAVSMPYVNRFPL